MSIEVVCPEGHRIKVKDRYVGKTVKCPACKSHVRIPAQDQEVQGGLVRGILNPKKFAGDVWEFIDDPSDENEEAQPDHCREGVPTQIPKQVDYGELVPLDGGDNIPLLKPDITVGRRKGCDLVLQHHNVSASHAQLRVVDGYWHVRDLKSSNGVRVNGERVREEQLDPGDIVSFADHEFVIKYTPTESDAVAIHD